MHTFDLRVILFAKHAQHIILVHFPIALYLTGVGFDLLAEWRRVEALATAAFYNFTVAALSVLPTVATGVLAWQWQLEGARLKGDLLLHLVLAISSAALILLVWLMHLRLRQKNHVVRPGVRLAIETFAVLLVAVTAHLGGSVAGLNSSS